MDWRRIGEVDFITLKSYYGVTKLLWIQFVLCTEFCTVTIYFIQADKSNFCLLILYSMISCWSETLYSSKQALSSVITKECSIWIWYCFYDPSLDSKIMKKIVQMWYSLNKISNSQLHCLRFLGGSKARKIKFSWHKFWRAAKRGHSMRTSF